MTEGRARRSFRLKVEKLEQAAIKGSVPEEIPVIDKIDDLRAWHDPPMCAWKSFSVAAPSGPNPDLRHRFDQIFPTFRALQTGKPKRGPRPPKDTSVELWLIHNERDALVRQNADLLVRVHELETALRVEKAIVESLKAKIAQLTDKLRTLLPLRSLGG